MFLTACRKKLARTCHSERSEESQADTCSRRRAMKKSLWRVILSEAKNLSSPWSSSNPVLEPIYQFQMFIATIDVLYFFYHFFKRNSSRSTDEGGQHGRHIKTRHNN